MKTSTRMALLRVLSTLMMGMSLSTTSEAPSGFDGQTIDPAFVSPTDHAGDQAKFDGVERAEDGLGPLYNAQSCRECHQNPTSGGVSQVTELRVGHRRPDGRFENPTIPINDGQDVITGRTLINDRALCPQIQERVPQTETIRTTRLSLNTLGDGFIEAVADETLLKLRDQQCRATHRRICGQALRVPVLEAPGTTAVGRFGWKDQHASLLSFSADAYLNEMGITNRLLRDEVTSVCNPQGMREPNDQPDPPDTLEDVDRFARFMRASKVPPRDAHLAETEAGKRGSQLFDAIGCAICHVRSLQTAAAGTRLHGGQYTIPAALGGKMFHPYSDLLLHDVGTRDGIAIAVVEHYGVPREEVETAYRSKNTTRGLHELIDRLMHRAGFSHQALYDSSNKVRTPPLWGLRTHTRLMHDGASVRVQDAILRHQGEATDVTRKFRRLTPQQASDLLTFLSSL